MSKRIVIDLDVLTNVIDAARASRPSRRLESAYEWLAPLASVTMDGAHLVVDSATWSHSWYRVNEHGCSCTGHAHGRACWHMEAWNLVQECRRVADAHYPAVSVAAPLPRLIDPRVRHGAHHVSYKAAQSSGLDELFA